MESNKQLVEQKVAQATSILEEYDVDSWLTFVRETSLSPDPTLELIVGMDMVWHSAFLLNRDGRHVAIVGYYDAENVRNLGVYDEVIGYHKGIGQPLREVLAVRDPEQIAINYSKTDVAADGLSHGMYLVLQELLEETPYGDRLQSAERLVSALRGRKSPLEVERVRQAVVMRRNRIGSLLEAGLPPDTPLAHRHAWVGDTHADAGIVFSPGGDYVIVEIFYQQEWLPWEKSSPLMADVARATYNYFNFDNPYLESSRTN